MPGIACSVFRRLSLISLCLLAAYDAAAGARSVSADFDGDGQRDRAEFDRHEPYALRVRLSAGHITIVLRSGTPFVGLAALDLDADARAELIASDASSQLQVFTHRLGGGAGLQPFHPRRKGPAGVSRSTDHRIDERSDDAAPSGESRGSTPLAWTKRSQPAVRTRRLVARPVSDRAGPASTCLRASFSPRPPPRTCELQPARV